MPQARLVLATALWTVLIVGCKPVEQPVAPSSPSAAGVIIGGEEVAVVEHPSQLLPRDTQMVGWVAGVNRAAEVFERDRLVAKFPELFDRARSEIVEELGYDILDPASYPAAGIDPTGRTGGAVISFQDEAGAFFFTLTDAGKFKQAVRNAVGRQSIEFVETQYGPATLMADPSGKSEASIVIRDKIGMIVVQEQNEEVAIRYAESIAKLDPRQSLAASVEYRKALGGLRDSDAMAFVNIGLLVAQAGEPSRHEETNWAEQELAAAKQRGAAEEEIAALTESVASEARWKQERAARDDAERRIVERLFEGVESLGFAIAVKRTGPVLDGQFVVREGGFLRRLVKVSPEGLALPNALNGEPIALFGGNVDIDAAIELADLFAQAEGESLHDAGKVLADELLGINPLDELVPLLTGEITAAATLEAPIDYARLDELPKHIGLTFHAAVRDAAKVEALLAKIADSKTVAGLAVKKEAGEYVFEVPRFRTMRAVVAGPNLLVTTDKGLAGRLATRTAGSMRKDADPPDPFYVATLPNVGAAWVTDVRYLVGWFFFGMSGFDSRRPSDFDLGHGEVDWAEVEATRMSRTSKQKKAALEAARADLEQQDARVTGKRTELLAASVRSFGSSAFVIQPNERGFSLVGGQFLGTATLGGLVETMLTMSMMPATDDSIDTAKLDAAFATLRTATDAYRAARLADYERANKGGRGKKPRKEEKKAAAVEITPVE